MRDISNQHHSFSVAAACKVGVNCAVIIQSIYYWVTKNEANEKNHYDGHYWTYNSVSAFSELFPYLSARQISTALRKLEDEGYILTGNYNKMKWDRTKWYALTEAGYALAENAESISQNSTMDSPEVSNREDENGEPIPVSNPVTVTSSNTDRERKRKRFTPPTRQECIDYAREKHPSVDGGRFWDYYTEGEWHDSNGKPVKNWKLKMNTWDSHEQPRSGPKRGRSDQPADLVKLPYGMLPRGMVKTDEEIAQLMDWERTAYYGNARTYQERWEKSNAGD